MATQNYFYKGKNIKIDVSDELSKRESLSNHHNNHTHHGEVKLTIDEKDIHVMSLPDGNYSAHLLPYEKYSTPQKLAESIVDKVPLFNIKNNKEKNQNGK
jgi:hypothetical protein